MLTRVDSIPIRHDRYTDEQRAWIDEHYPDNPNERLAEMYAERFGEELTMAQLHAYGSNHGLRKTERAKHDALATYTDEENDFLREFIPGHSESEIIAAFAERFGRTLTVAAVSNRKVRLGVRSGTQGGCFRKGEAPPNKGKTWDEFMPPESQERCKTTWFRKGEIQGIAVERARPLLNVRDADGYLHIKVAPRNTEYSMQNWIPLSEFVWMQANGRDFPDGHHAVFADHDNRNFDPDNIVAVPDDVYPIVTGGGKRARSLPYYDRESLETAILHARVIRERTRLERASHTCKVCGKTFDARYKHQVTCDECLSKGLRAPRGRRKE